MFHSSRVHPQRRILRPFSHPEEPILDQTASRTPLFFFFFFFPVNYLREAALLESGMRNRDLRMGRKWAMKKGKKQARVPFSYDSSQGACVSLKYYRAGVRFIYETCRLSGQQRVWGHLWFSVLTQCLMFRQAGCLLACWTKPCTLKGQSLCFYSGESGASFKLL